MRGWVCCFQLLLVLASAVIITPESRGTHDHILVPQILDSHNLEGRSPSLYPGGTCWPGYASRHWICESVGSSPQLHPKYERYGRHI
jgi:hypothetical protein